MIRKCFGFSVLIVFGVILLALSSCAREQQLQSINVTPNSVTFLSPGTTITFQLKAYGTYIHPPETKDITNLVTWASQSTDLVEVTSVGVLSSSQTGHCGITSVTASMSDPGGPSGNVIVGTATATVVDTTNPVCPQ
jgi:hypothetical protein